MKTAMKFIILSFFLFISGCVYAIDCDFSDLEMAQNNSARQSMKVAILPCEDLRPEKEIKGSANFSKDTKNYKDQYPVKAASYTLKEIGVQIISEIEDVKFNQIAIR